MCWTPDSIVDMAKRMEARPNGFRVSARTAPLIIEAIRLYAREHFADPMRESAFAIDVWDKSGNSIVERIARVGNLEVAGVAYAAAQKVRPDKLVTLRQGIRVVESSDRE